MEPPPTNKDQVANQTPAVERVTVEVPTTLPADLVGESPPSPRVAAADPNVQKEKWFWQRWELPSKEKAESLSHKGVIS